MGLRLADARGLWRAVDAVVLLREVDPHDANGIVRPGSDARLGMGSVGVPEEVGVVEERRIALDALDLPLADRKRVVHATHGRRIPAERAPTRPFRGHREIGLVDDEPHDLARRRLRPDVGHFDCLAGAAPAGARVQALEQLGAGVEPLRDRLEHRSVAERVELRLLHHVLWDLYSRGPTDVLFSERIGAERLYVASVQERITGSRVLATPVHPGIARERALGVAARLASDLARREVRAIE